MLHTRLLPSALSLSTLPSVPPRGGLRGLEPHTRGSDVDDDASCLLGHAIGALDVEARAPGHAAVDVGSNSIAPAAAHHEVDAGEHNPVIGDDDGAVARGPRRARWPATARRCARSTRAKTLATADHADGINSQ